MAERAEAIYASLLKEDPERILLHGDLHHGNLLLDESRGWIIIDPKGVVGPPVYESGAMLRNPPGVHLRQKLDAMMSARVELISEVLGDDPEMITAWAFAQAVLSVLWSMEDSQPGWEAEVALARCFEELHASYAR